MSSLKLEDVIHYYAFSNVYGEKNWGIAAIFHTPLEKPQRAQLTLELARLIQLQEISFVPILRALEDMTEGEAKQLCDVVGEIWRKDFEFGYESGLEYLHKKEVADNWRNIDYFMGEPVAWSWLIAKGFDVFGLIDSGQAIRKGVENG